MWHVVCTRCKHPYPEVGVPYLCSECGGIYDLESFPKLTEDLSCFPEGIWGYYHEAEPRHQITLGEGNTPLVWDVLKSVEGEALEVGYKCEFINPTGSFKDRGSAFLVSFLKERGITEIVEDSSGNAGASISAYGTRAGMKVMIYVPAGASGAKKQQMESYGAKIVEVVGSRSDVTKALIEKIQMNRSSAFAYASHAYLPFNLPGYASVAMEIFLQMKSCPGTIVVPAGQGGLLYGIYLGFRELQREGKIGELPMMVGVQARAVAPFYKASKGDTVDVGNSKGNATIAEGIRVSEPVRAKEILEAVKVSGGYFCAVDEDEIISGMKELARRGLFVEPTSAVVYPALHKHIHSMKQPVVAILTGTGHKTLEGYESANTY